MYRENMGEILSLISLVIAFISPKGAHIKPCKILVNFKKSSSFDFFSSSNPKT
jgi:hypothetical protein